ncbi:gliding motility lipoprotein GldB [Allomuricauda sp. SCSIO 65647]|uniref:gliding motility lipoprotein GldB n=1 Tax=Allomuricauda sp. SCSIO 65647 TaxID=2908843 RepID=UPI001F30DE3C|nr:gliding motility lipoprotein GldB [Muricauda sp. SCSIO 65647]UJH68216.1 gliding motility lipoprotein GldB [Muricauda sp. SCSIO 65647]
MKHRAKYLVILVSLAILPSCHQENRREAEIAKVPIDLKVLRFDAEFDQATPDDLPGLKAKYPYLFPERTPDSIWIGMMADTLQQQLADETYKVFGDFEAQEQQIHRLYQHIKYYFSEKELPKVVTLVSTVDYENRVVLADSLLLLGLDNYLGSDHKFYKGLSSYIAQGLDSKYLLSDVASAFTKKVNPYPRDRTFLSRMIYYGKELYLKDRFLPNDTDAQKIGYLPEQLQWAQKNEEQIWRFFIEQELLYSTDSKLDKRFLDPTPFSKFGLDFDNESPPRIGRYMGWQIVKAFMKKNDVTLQQLLALPADEIFKKSNYKPKR